jgi:hypothetical protein
VSLEYVGEAWKAEICLHVTMQEQYVIDGEPKMLFKSAIYVESNWFRMLSNLRVVSCFSLCLSAAPCLNFSRTGYVLSRRFAAL